MIELELISAPPKTRQIEDILTENINNGNLKPGERLGSIRALANKFSVSNKIIECVFDRLAVKKLVIKEAGCGTFVAEQNKGNFKQTIGFVTSLKENDPHVYFPSAFNKEASEREYSTSTFELLTLLQAPAPFKKFIKNKPFAILIDGLQSFPFELIDEIPKETRIIFINQFEKEVKFKNASYVLSDYSNGGYQATKELIQRGKRKIAIIHSEETPEYCVASQFLDGVKKALDEEGLELNLYFIKSKCDQEFCESMLGEKGFDGIVSLGDYRVIELFEVASKLKVDIAKDFPVIGYYNTPWAKAYKMTSVSLNETSMMKKVFEILDKNENVDILIKPKIIYRNSCPKL